MCSQNDQQNINNNFNNNVDYMGNMTMRNNFMNS